MLTCYPGTSLPPALLSPFLLLSPISLTIASPSHFTWPGPHPGQMCTRPGGCHPGGPRRAVQLPWGRGVRTSQRTQGRESLAHLHSPGWVPCTQGSRSCRSPLAREAHPPCSQLPSSDLCGKGRGRWPWSQRPSSTLHPETTRLWIVGRMKCCLQTRNLSAPCHALLHPAGCQCQLSCFGEPVQKQAFTPWLTLFLCPLNPGRPNPWRVLVPHP